MAQPDQPNPARRLHDAKEHFVASWADMAAHWGVPRSMTVVHAILFLEGAPMDMDQIMAAARISRGNASMTLRALEQWELVSRTPAASTRRDLFQAQTDAWGFFTTLLRVKKAREVDPLTAALRRCRTLAGSEAPSDPARAAEFEAFSEKLDGMLRVLTMIDAISEHLPRLGPGAAQDAVAGFCRPAAT